MPRARRITIVLVVAVAAVLPHVGAGRGPVAGAASRLPFEAFADLWVDHAHRRVFVTGGFTENEVQVLDYDGRPLRRIEVMPGASDMLVEGREMYVALAGAGEIAVVDLRTLDVVDRIDVTPFTSPRYLSKSGDTIYFSHSCEGGDPGFASVDLETRVAVPHNLPNASAEQCAEHAVVPSDPSTLLAWDDSGSVLRRYDVSARQPVPAGESDPETFFDRLAFSKDGKTFFSVSWTTSPEADAQVMRRRLADFSPVRRYAGSAVALALTPDERYLFTGDRSGYLVRTYRTAASKPLSTTELGSDYRLWPMLPGSLGATSNGDRAFAISGVGALTFDVVWPRYPVAAGPGDQSIPAAGGGFAVWSQRRNGARTDTLVARGGGRVFRVSPSGASGYAGGIEGRRLVYQVVRGGSSDLRLYDLARRRQVSTLARLNTRGWEWRPTISRGRILFSRYDGRIERVVLHTLRTGHERVLAAVPRRTQQAVAGQVNGQWAVWSQCRRVCTVYRLNLSTGKKTMVPGPKGRLDYAPAVTREGVVYFGRSGVGCGADVSFLRYSGGRVTELWDLPYGEDVFSIYAVPGTDTVIFDHVRCSADAWDVLRLRDSVR
ncbi:MAG: hypothetical protein ABR613_00485 [Actinomycetota bacterium]